MKLVLKSISQDVSIEDPDVSTAALVFEVEGTVPYGAPTTLRVPCSDEGIQAVVSFLGLAHSEPQEGGDANPGASDEEFDDGLEDDGQGPQDEHPDVVEGAEEFPPKQAAQKFPLQRRPLRPLTRQAPQEGDEDGVPAL
jgi:hypothetical protein